MLPSMGFFNSFECPFYKGGAGQCSRPYCHYRHVKKEPDPVTESLEDSNSSLLSLDSKPNQNEESERQSGDAERESIAKNKSRTAMYRAIVQAAPTYKPTPISVLRSSHLPIPYAPSGPTRSSVVKKSKAKHEYVPHSLGARTNYPPYCPSSLDSLRNPLYEIYGPEGAQFSPNDVEPVETGYSYAPTSGSSTQSVSSSSTEAYVPEIVKKNKNTSPPDSPPSDDDDNVDLALEAAAQTNGGLESGGEPALFDLDLSELDDLDLELDDDDDDDNREEIPEAVPDTVYTENEKESKESQIRSGSNKHSSHRSHSSSEKSHKRRSSSSSSNDIKRHKSSHTDENIKNNSDKKDVKSSSSSSSSSSKKRSSDRHESYSKDKKSKSSDNNKSSSKSSHSSSNQKSSSKSTTSSNTSSSKHHKSHSSSDSKSKSNSSHSSRHKDKVKSSERSKHKEKEDEKKKPSSLSRTEEPLQDSDNDLEGLQEEMRKIEQELSDPSQIEQECLEMFNEYSESTSTNKNTQLEDQRITVNDDPIPVMATKKRIAHQIPNTSYETSSKPSATLARKCSPYEVMQQRWRLLKKDTEKTENRISDFAKTLLPKRQDTVAVAPSNVPKLAYPKPYSSTSTVSSSKPSTAKIKIASASNVSALLKPPVSSSSSSKPTLTTKSPNRFYSQDKERIDIHGRIVKMRVAHTPNMDTPKMKTPVVNPSDTRKFKVVTRQANVKKLFEAYLEAGFGESAHDMALQAEKSSTQGTESLGVYSHRIIQILKDLRSCAESSQNGPKVDGWSGVPNRVVSHCAMLAGKLGSKVSWSIESAKKSSETKVSPTKLYEQLQPYILTKEQLEENGFPMASPEKGVARIKPRSFRVIQQPSDPRHRICTRCLKPYTVNKHGEQTKEEECFFHWGRKITTRRFRGEAETKYTCCDGGDIQGCSVSPYHVFEQGTNQELHSGFMYTLSKPWMESNAGVYALDCEMVYTTAGTELARITVIKDDLTVAYEALVKPEHKVLDYNTRFSGLTEKDLQGVETNILKVQASLLAMFCDKTILIGHSLESDLKALKLIHPTVVDTSVVFPHKMGPPQKKALRTLAADYLKRIIQNDVGGHDSKEDAVAAMELMLWKLKEDEKGR